MQQISRLNREPSKTQRKGPAGEAGAMVEAWSVVLNATWGESERGELFKSSERLPETGRWQTDEGAKDFKSPTL